MKGSGSHRTHFNLLLRKSNFADVFSKLKHKIDGKIYQISLICKAYITTITVAL